MLALVLALGATPLAVYADEGEGTTQSETSTVSEVSEGTSETKQLKAGEIRVQTSDGFKIYPADTADKFREAMKDALPGSTIELGAGTYGLYKSDTATTPEEKAAWKALMKEKTFTFVGQKPEETFWRIGTPTVEQSGEANGDYSFDGAEQVTFKKMTLLASVTPEGNKESRNYTGFIRADNTLVEDCVIDGMTFYWGYVSAEFKNTKFICGQNKYAYALWTYSSPLETFDHCTFDASANPERSSVIYVHNDGSDKHFTINFKDCTVIAPQSTDHNSPKQVLYIEDSNPRKFTINISGNNIISGDVPVDSITCSRLIGFGGKEGNNNSNTIVNFGNTTVWKDGQMVDAAAYHNSGVTADGVNYNNNVDGSNNSLYAEGYKDNAFDTTTGEWTTNPDGTITRDVTKKCTYCGYEEKVTERQVKLTYDANGGAGTIDSTTGAAGESVNVAKNVFTRNNYTFTGWNTQADGKGTAYKPGDSFTLTDKDTVLYAQWSKNSGSAGTGTNGTAKPTDIPKTGDNSNLTLWFALLIVSGGAVIATAVISSKKKRSEK